MKKLFLIFFTFLAAGSLQAQTPEQANQDLYNERYAGAQQKFLNILNQAPANADAWYGWTRSVHLQQRKNNSFDAIYQAPASVKNEPLFQAAYGYALLAQQKPDSANLYFQQALNKTRHKNVSVLLAVAQAHVETKAGNANYALELIEKALKKDKDNPAIFALQGDAYLKLQDGSKAYQAYSKATELKSSYAPAFHKLGKIFVAQKSQNLYLEFFSKALAADPSYAPSLYQMYAHYFYMDTDKALDFFNRYAAVSDQTIERDYDLADIQYLTKKYSEALTTAEKIMKAEGNEVQPRIYKLMAYSYAGLQDTANATASMNNYFAHQADSNILFKDYELMAALARANGSDSSNYYLGKAIELEKDPEARFAYYKKLADAAKAEKDYTTQALWLEKFYTGNDKATNVDLFNWGLAYYLGQDYKKADSIFSIYVGKYPEQSFGYYWQARANVALDKDMKEGLAVPVYQKLVEVLTKNTADPNYKKWMAEAFGYMAAYEANTEKDYDEAIDYFEKVLEVDPENESAKKYISILEKDLKSQESDSK